MIDGLAAWPDDPGSREDWLAAAARVLDQASAEAVPPGGLVAPLQARARGALPVRGRAPGRRWRIVQRVDHPNAAAANGLALADLSGGADGLSLVLAGAPSAHGYGLAGTAALAPALDGVDARHIGLRLEAGTESPEAIAALLALLRAADIDPMQQRIALGHDPLGGYAVGRALPSDWLAEADRLLAAVSGAGSGITLFAADGRPYHDAGASAPDELACILAGALAYLRAAQSAGLGPDQAFRLIGFVAVVDQDLFVSIAKLRALRLLMGRIEEACGLVPASLDLHAESSWRMTTRRDPHSDMLRGTVAGFAAGLAGADSVTLLPFTIARGLPDAFARRVARNTQHILMSEANLHRVADPAAGSGTVEALTDRLCFEAWRLLQEIERRGGLPDALADGFLAQRVAETRDSATEPVIVGTTRFAPDEPVVVSTLAACERPEADQGMGDRVATPLVPGRLAETFEAAS